MKRIFFYGLFMDATLLQTMGLHPRVYGAAKLPGYQIRIGQRASLIPNPRARAYGLLIDLAAAEAQELYSGTDVCDYRAEVVNAVMVEDGSTQMSLCYTLPVEEIGTRPNRSYAEQLVRVLSQLGFPPNYGEEILAQIN